jgi:molybdopterin-guanine dinucleotide biosynthesis protein A
MLINDCTGVVLAGGKSSRFGSNKALVKLTGKPLIKYPCKVLDDLFGKNLLITNTPDQYNFLGWPTVADIYPGAGPLAGIHAALSAIDTPLMFVAGCDMPFLDRELIAYLHSLATDFDAVVPHTVKGLEPLHAVYRRNTVAVIAENLRKGVFRLHDILSGLKIREVGQNEIIANSATGLDSFRNINTLDDLKTNE